MIEVTATAEPEPRIEICRLCHFLWFDADELTHFAPLPPKPSAVTPEMSADARAALAIAETELMRRAAERDEDEKAVWRQLAQILTVAGS